MLARAYAEWLLGHEPSDESRAAVVSAVVRILAEQEARPLPRLRILDLSARTADPLAGKTQAWLLGLSAERDRGETLVDRRLAGAQVLGEIVDLLHGVESSGRRSGDQSLRRSSGSYFTPRAVARSLVEESLSTPQLRATAAGRVRVCDPAMGGGAFLLEAVAGLARLRISEGQAADVALGQVGSTVFGVDQSLLAVATAEAALWFLTDLADWTERLMRADALAREVAGRIGECDWLIGNPPWVAFQGRAAQKLEPERRAWLKRTYSAFAGYPTLHGVFAERATELAPRGFVSLLLPSSLSDLDGYRAARRAVQRTHHLHEPLLEYGQDAFSGVVQPCFGLVASPRNGVPEADLERPWRLRERARHEAATGEPGVPAVLRDLASLPKLPAACFGELGLQSNRRVTAELFLRAQAPREPFVVPLLEGRNVRAFEVDPPRLFMNPDPEVLQQSRCRYRPSSDYQRVGFVVRQTAALTIAARHSGLRFRNSLLAGYAVGEFDTELLLGLLNSSLFRAFHSSHQRDARQATFPQVKVAHLRRLPAPPASPADRGHVRQASEDLCRQGPSEAGQAALDAAVFDLYGISAVARLEVTQYLAARCPPRRQV
jgi:hypothetical protein